MEGEVAQYPVGKQPTGADYLLDPGYKFITGQVQHRNTDPEL
jgi:hypothetical protein